MFGQPATSSAFGAPSGGFATNSAFGAAKPGFGATSTPSFGAFGATTSTATAPSFGAFGATTSTASAPSFGAFGVAASTAPSAFGFGAAAGHVTSSSAPSFGSSFGTPGFGSSFGTATQPSFGTFGGGSSFGQAGTNNFLQPQGQVQAAPAGNANDQLLNSIMRVNLFGDDRDNLLARWNLLQASWGMGKAFYAPNQGPPVSLSNDNPLCRFKALGYSAIPKANEDTELLCLIVRKKPNEVEANKASLIADLQAALGNKPNVKATIDEIQAYGNENSQVIFHLVESSSSGMHRKIPANDIYNALNQGQTWSQLQQRQSLESLYPKVAFSRAQLEEYLKHPPYGVDPRLWKQAQLDNPNKKSMVPVPLVGFKALQARIKRQEHQAKIYQGRLDGIANDIAESGKRQQDNTAKLRDAKRKQLELSHRLLNIITRQEMTRKLGFTIQMEEEKLRIQLEALQSQLSAPTQFKGRLNELLSQVRLQSQVNGLGSGSETHLDQFAKEDVKLLLKQQHEGIQSLVATMKQDLNALELMNEKLSKNPNANNK